MVFNREDCGLWERFFVNEGFVRSFRFFLEENSYLDFYVKFILNIGNI